MNNQPKIIGVGFHKTGLTSLLTALRILGFNTVKGRAPYKNEISDTVEKKILKDKNYEQLFPYIQSYDAFVDNPWNIIFKELDEKFPDSKFIFTYRAERDWLNSAKHYFRQRPDTIMRRWIYRVASCNEITDNMYLNRYRAHNECVLSYFKGREKDCLELNITKDEGWEKLCPFLNKPVLKLPFPKQNTNLVR